MAKRTAHVTRLKDLQLDIANANRGTESGRQMLEQSFREVGAGRSVVVDKHGNVIAGNKSLEVWAELSEDVEIVQTDGTKLVIVQREDLDLSDPTGPARRLAYFDNRSSEVGLQWHVEQISTDLAAGVDFTHIFSEDVLQKVLHDIKQAPKEFPTYDEHIKTEHTCPKCGYEWSGTA